MPAVHIFQGELWVQYGYNILIIVYGEIQKLVLLITVVLFE